MPFTGQQTIIWTHQVNGKLVINQLAGTVARDGQGRIHREGHRFSVDPVDPRTTLTNITVQDPVAGTTTDCDLATHFCRITTFPATAVTKAASSAATTTKEDLGSKVIDGLVVTGTRTTRTPIPNALDASPTDDKIDVDTLIIEMWRSDELKADLTELRKYPHGEVQEVHLTITTRAEPDPKIFAIPAGFTVRDDRALRRIGGDVSPPVLIYSVKPGFAEEARRAKIAGNVIVNLVVDENGIPTYVRLFRGAGHGLDEKAIEAVSKYRFKPAMEHGKPVPVEINVDVNFQIF
jgi:TonB family protein